MTIKPRRQSPANTPVAQIGIDLRLTTDQLAQLSAEQVQAVFEGVGHLAALGLGRAGR